MKKITTIKMKTYKICIMITKKMMILIITIIDNNNYDNNDDENIKMKWLWIKIMIDFVNNLKKVPTNQRLLSVVGSNLTCHHYTQKLHIILSCTFQLTVLKRNEKKLSDDHIISVFF